MKWYLGALKKYVDFTGRAHRTEYWMFFLFYFIFAIALGFVDVAMGTQIIGIIYSLALLLPSLAIGARRLHDIGRSGWWQLILLIPLIGAIVILIFYVTDSQAGSNEYGPNPKEAAPA